MIQLVLVGVVVLALGSAFWSYSSGQRDIGEARAVAEYEKQQKVVAEANAMKALEGEAYALKLLGEAERRNKAQAAAIAAARQQREVIYVEREKMDPELKAWGAVVVPEFAAFSLREHAKSVAATARSDSVPAQSSVEVSQTVASDTGAVDESWAQKLRRRVAGLVSGGVDGSGQTGR